MFLLALTMMMHSGPARAFGFGVGAGAIHLPASSYHYLGYSAHLAFGADDSHFRWSLGSTHPYSGHGFSQMVMYTQFGWEWMVGKGKFFRPYAGLGAGVFFDKVQTQIGVVPSLASAFGLRIGGSGLSLDLSVAMLLGIYSPAHLTYFTMWPMINAMAGISVGM